MCILWVDACLPRIWCRLGWIAKIATSLQLGESTVCLCPQPCTLLCKVLPKSALLWPRCVLGTMLAAAWICQRQFDPEAMWPVRGYIEWWCLAAKLRSDACHDFRAGSLCNEGSLHGVAQCLPHRLVRWCLSPNFGHCSLLAGLQKHTFIQVGGPESWMFCPITGQASTGSSSTGSLRPSLTLSCRRRSPRYCRRAFLKLPAFERESHYNCTGSSHFLCSESRCSFAGALPSLPKLQIVALLHVRARYNLSCQLRKG